MGDQAVRAFQVSAKAAPDDPQYHYHLGLAYLKAGKARQAAEELRLAIKLQPDFRLAQLALETLEKKP